MPKHPPPPPAAPFVQEQKCTAHFEITTISNYSDHGPDHITIPKISGTITAMASSSKQVMPSLHITHHHRTCIQAQLGPQDICFYLQWIIAHYQKTSPRVNVYIPGCENCREAKNKVAELEDRVERLRAQNETLTKENQLFEELVKNAWHEKSGGGSKKR